MGGFAWYNGNMLLIANRKARSEYAIDKTYTAGMVLTGPEVKSLRAKKGSLSGSYVKIIGNEAFLLNAQINPYDFADNREYEPKRTRKLLLNRREIEQLQSHLEQKGRTLVPLAINLVGRHIKLEVGVGRGLKQHEQRAKLKKRDLERDLAREMKYRR